MMMPSQSKIQKEAIGSRVQYEVDSRRQQLVGSKKLRVAQGRRPQEAGYRR